MSTAQITIGGMDIAPAQARDWSTEPDGPGSGDDRYGDVPAQEEAA